MRRIVEFARPVVVEDLREDARMPVEKVLVEHRIVVDKSFRQPRQSCSWDFLQSLLYIEID